MSWRKTAPRVEVVPPPRPPAVGDEELRDRVFEAVRLASLVVDPWWLSDPAGTVAP